MLDIMIEGVAVPNAFERQPGYGLNQLGQVRLRGFEPAIHV
jgi:hypothetical protein